MAEKKTTTRKTTNTTRKPKAKVEKTKFCGGNWHRLGDTVRIKGAVFKVTGFTKKGLELTSE